MKCDCKSVFNRLSKVDRFKLKSAALSKAITGFIKDDTEAHPARYPLYAAYLVVAVTPLPVPFASTALIAATAVWARYSKTDYAARLQGRLKEAFNDAALVCQHREFLQEHREKPGSHHVKNLALAWHTTKRTTCDSWHATKHAWKALMKSIPG